MKTCSTPSCNSNNIIRGTNLCYNCYVQEKETKEGNKPKRSVSHEEDDIQEAFFNTARLVFPKLGKLLFAVPNGGKRNAREAARMKKQGVTPGVADIICLVPNKEYNCLGLECKTEKGKQSNEQKEFQKQVEQTGGLYIIFHSAAEGIEILKEYLNNK